MFIKLNLNPFGLDTGDCVIRAITLALNYNWFGRYGYQPITVPISLELD